MVIHGIITVDIVKMNDNMDECQHFLQKKEA